MQDNERLASQCMAAKTDSCCLQDGAGQQMLALLASWPCKTLCVSPYYALQLVHPALPETTGCR